MSPEKIQRFASKIRTFQTILNEIAELSVSQTAKVACLAIKKDFSSIASFGYNGTYPNCPTNPHTGGEELSLEPGESGFLHAEDNMISKFRERDPENYMVFISMSPCRECAMRLVNAGFKDVFWEIDYRDQTHLPTIFQPNDVQYMSLEDLLDGIEHGWIRKEGLNIVIEDPYNNQ